jgi:hypothetical protein
MSYLEVLRLSWYQKYGGEGGILNQPLNYLVMFSAVCAKTAWILAICMVRLLGLFLRSHVGRTNFALKQTPN